MFCDVTLLTGADVKTFQRETGEKKGCIRRKRATLSSVCMNVCVCACARMSTEGQKREAPHMNERVGVFDVLNRF